VEAEVTAAKRITIDDLRDKAEDIRDSVQEDVRRVAQEDAVKVAVAAAVVVAVGISFAFYLGTRRCR
jgi:hypothetical protein